MRTLLLALLLPALASAEELPTSPVRGMKLRSEYLRADHRVVFEVPEVQELLHIVIALTPTGRASRSLVDQSTDYYAEVMRHFGSVPAAPLLAAVDQALRENRYAGLKMDSVALTFEGPRIVPGPAHDRLGWDAHNNARAFVEGLEDFARRSGFRRFYADHAGYYARVLKEAQRLTALDDRWCWLEGYFDAGYGGYRIMLSPLAAGSHAASRLDGRGLRGAVAPA